MLKKLRIERFKSIYHADLDFGRANLFVGPNGSGKSNILEALGILAAALSRGIDQTALDLRGVRLSLPHLFKSAFKNYKLPQAFNISAHFEYGKYECSIRSGKTSPYLEFHSEALYDHDRQVFGRSPRGSRVYGQSELLNTADLSGLETNRSIWDLVGPLLKISNEFRSEVDEFCNFVIYSPQTAVMRGLAIDARVIEPLGLTGSGLAQAFQEVIMRMRGLTPDQRRKLEETLSIIWKPGWADNIRIQPYNPEIVPPQVRSEGSMIYIRDKFMNLTRNMLSPFDASEGTLYLIFVATLLAHENAPKCFALDNVDGTLNPNLVRQLTDHIVRISCQNNPDAPRHQVFMTSHHPSALDSFDIFNEHHKVFTVNRSKENVAPLGSTSFTPIKPPKGMSSEDWSLTHQGKNLSQLLLEGRIPGALF